jgi:putative transposase
MRRARLTYPGAFHHVMNRGIRGEYIFPDDNDKQIFLEILAEKAKLIGGIWGRCLTL